MKMTKTFAALCLSAALLAGQSAPAFAEVNLVPQDLSAAPALPAGELQHLQWMPVDQSRTQVTTLANTGQRLNAPSLAGPVAAYSLSANIGELTVTLTSEVQQKQVFAPNVLVLDENMRPAAWFPSRYFTYQQPGVMAADRLEGVMKLTPALGQQKIYLLVFTTQTDLTQTTTMLDPAKAYAKGTGHAVPDIPDPIARHTTNGTLKLKVKTNSGSSILVGPLFGSSGPGAVTVGNSGPAQASAAYTPAVAPAAKREPMLNDTESYFNQGIRQAVERGNIDRALKLLDEAERLGSTSARSVFISSVKGKG